ncbi:hypothetical protein EDD21DRAFT_294723, partial [Dissophora ornata]
MGVKGLWELLHPVARPIKLENLSNKHLAIDASIWLHQFLRGMRDKEGQVIGNAHLIGFFRRICKLLYYNVKPIFVFDGGTPALKRLTIQERRRRKKQDANMVKRTAEKLLAAQLRLRALEQRKAARKKKEQEKQDMANNVVHDSADNPTYLGEIKDDDAISAGKSNNETGLGSQAKRTKDRYLLPPMEVDFDTLSKLRSHDERFGYQAEDDVSKFMNEFKTEAGVANIDSDVFKALPSEVQYEILHDIRLRSRVTSYDRVQEMVRLSNTPMDFSKLQVQGVIRRNNATHKLLTVNQAVSKMDEVTKPGRIASQRNRQYVLVKNEEGGWVLGGKKPETGATPDKPVQLDSDEDEAKIKDGVKEELEEDWVSDDEDGDVELEEVKIPQISLGPTLASHDTSRFNTESKTTTIRPIAPKAAVKADDSNSLINHLEAYMDENESIESVMAKFAEIEDEAVRKRDMDDGERTNEMNGLHLIREQDVIQPPEAMLTVNEAPKSEDSKTPRRPILDFSSSILKRWTPSSAPEQTSVEMSTETILSLALESTVKSTQEVADDGIDLTTVIDETASDSGVGSLTSSPGPDLEAAVVPSLDKDGEKATNDMSLAEEGIMADEKELEALTKDIAEAKAEVTLEDGDDEEEEADLVNEEQDFTNLFPDMASLPGAILNPREPLPPPETQETRPVLSAEDKAALEKQDARKMFEESKQLESEIRALQDQHRKHQRDADDLTESMVAETKMLLRLFGIPYLVAPMEAEAQCADLQLRGVVDGILTEDSDVFLFGGARVFKNMFKEEKYVECYLMSDVERDLGVGRDRLVALAYLLGSDYTAGVKGIGLITAMEIIRLFPKLENFARWWRGEQHKVDGADDVDGKYNEKGLTELELDSMDEQCKKIHIPSSFPDPHIAEAYIRPIVDDDPAKFQWGIPDLDGLRDFLRKSLGWDRGEVDRALLPIIRQMSSVQQPTQTTLDSFFDNSVGMGSFQLPMKTTLLKSARLRKAV